MRFRLEFSEKHHYIITTYKEATELPWSEFNNNQEWGGKNISLDQVPLVIDTLRDLQAINASQIQLMLDDKQFDRARNTLDKLLQRNLITGGAQEKIEQLIQKHRATYFEKNIMLSNGDFYPKNLLVSNGKPYLVDWDGAQLNTLEQVSMYFWCSMVGNKEFQKNLLEEYKQMSEWNRDRYLLGLVLATTEDICGWMDNTQCSDITKKYVSYLENLDIIFEENI